MNKDIRKKSNKEEIQTKHCVECGAKIREKAEMCPKYGAEQPLFSHQKNVIKKTKSKKSKDILGWIFGAMLGLAILGALISSQMMLALILFVMTLVLLPPSSNFIKEKLNLNLSTGIKITIIVFGLFIIGLTAGMESTTTSNILKNTELNQDLLTGTSNENIVESKKYIFEPFSGNPTVNKCVDICYEGVGIDASYAKTRCKEFCKDIDSYKGKEGLRDAIDTYQQKIITKKNEILVEQDKSKGVYDSLIPSCVSKIIAQYDAENKLYSYMGRSNHTISEKMINDECMSKITLKWINNGKTPELGSDADRKKAIAIEKYAYVSECTNITFQKYYLMAIINNPIITINNFNNDTELTKIKNDCYNEKEKYFWPEGYIIHVTNELIELQKTADFISQCKTLIMEDSKLGCETGETSLYLPSYDTDSLRLSEYAHRECKSISDKKDTRPDFYEIIINGIITSISNKEKLPKQKIC